MLEKGNLTGSIFRFQLYLTAFALLLSQTVIAQHLDVEVWGEGNALFVGYCRTPGVVGCDLVKTAQMLELPDAALPREATTGKLIFMADFRDFSGGDFRTRNPGFQSVRNGLLPNELIGYRALGALRYWDSASSSWGRPPDDTQVSLFGGLEASAEVKKDFQQCAGQLLCFSDGSFGIDGRTVFSADGIQGNPELVVDITNSNGVLHTHLSFFLENQRGEAGGPIGAYLIEMQLHSNARFFPSEPFLILFNAGLDEAEFAKALSALIGDPSGTHPAPTRPALPASIPGDVDLDGDVDRIDVALILLAAQNNEEVHPNNARFDVNGDGIIDRADALLAKKLCTLRLCRPPIIAPPTIVNAAAVFDINTGTLSLNDIQAGSQHYRAQLQQQDETRFVLITVQTDKPRYAIPVRYGIETGLLEIPSVHVHGKNYKATLRSVGGNQFNLEHLEEIGGGL